MIKKVAQAEYVAQRDVWTRWFKTLNISKPVNPNITFAGVIKSGIVQSLSTDIVQSLSTDIVQS